MPSISPSVRADSRANENNQSITPILIGIAGGSGSGKTHLARQIQAAEPEMVALISMDQYFKTEVTGDATNVNFDHPAHLDLDLMLTHLQRLRAGGNVLAPFYDFRTRRQEPESVAIPPRPIVLVDGLFVLAEPFSAQMDLTCFLDVTDDQRLLGRILRDVKERDEPIEHIIDRYQRFVRPSYHVFVAPTKQNADIVVDFTYRRELFSELLIHIVRDYVRNLLDLPALVAKVRRENYKVGYPATATTMPMAVDIREMAKAYPESSRPPAVPAEEAEEPRLFLRTGKG